jgi:hypothetical protein
MQSDKNQSVFSRSRGDNSSMPQSAAVPEIPSNASAPVVSRRTALAAFAAVGLGVPLVKASAPLSGVRSPHQASNRKHRHSGTVASPLASPADLVPFLSPPLGGEGAWQPAGRLVQGNVAVFTTTIRPLDTPTVVAGLAWMDTKLLRARLYSGSLSPGGLFWKYTAPVSPGAARTLVAAFNGGFLLKDSRGGYLSEGHLVAPLVTGGASLVIYEDGTATVGQWGRDVSMTPSVIAVRQNLTLIVDEGTPVPGLARYDVSAWGASLNGIVDTPRSALGVTASGALVYVEGQMNVVDLARMLVRAGAVHAMVLDMNPDWPVFATYTPVTPVGLASAANGRDLNSSMIPTPARFFESAYARDFITMSAV